MTDDTQHSDSSETPVTLSPADAGMMDAILGEGGEVRKGETTDAQREERLRAWLKVLAAAPVAPLPVNLANRTLAAVQRVAQGDHMKMPATADAPEIDFNMPVRRRWSRRLAEIGAMAVAASLLLAVILMGLDQAHQSKARTACAMNMQLISTGTGTYSAAYAGQLPSLGVPEDRNWLHSNSKAPAARTNSANLLPLITGKYLTLANFYCAGAGIPAVLPTIAPNANELPGIGYSYIYMYGTVRPAWNGNHATIILTDRNPMFMPDSAMSTADKNSWNHGGKGNYALRADGAVSWDTSPNIGPAHDNIWTVMAGKDRVMSYTGVEGPGSAGDAFVCP